MCASDFHIQCTVCEFSVGEQHPCGFVGTAAKPVHHRRLFDMLKHTTRQTANYSIYTARCWCRNSTLNVYRYQHKNQHTKSMHGLQCLLRFNGSYCLYGSQSVAVLKAHGSSQCKKMEFGTPTVQFKWPTLCGEREFISGSFCFKAVDIQGCRGYPGTGTRVINYPGNKLPG